MEYLYLGKIVNTHGIKGELRIKSSFDYIEKAFKVGNYLYIGPTKIKEEITSYRHHKDFEMVTFKGYTNINEVLKYLKEDVYIEKSSLNLHENEYCLEELIGFNVYENGRKVGIVKEIVYNGSNILLSIKAEKNFYLPHNPYFIKSVDLNNKEIEALHTEGLIL